MELQYREHLAENNIKLEDLPSELQKMAKVVDANLQAYEENQDEEFKKKLVTQDVQLADAIQDWIENEIEGEEYIEEVEKAQEEQDSKEKAIQEAIMSHRANDGRVHKSHIAQIIGRQPNQTEKIGNMTLKKGFLSEYWSITMSN